MKIIIIFLYLLFIHQFYCSYQNRESDEEALKIFIAGRIQDSQPARYINGNNHDLIEINVSKFDDSAYINSNEFSYLDKGKNLDVYSNEISATIKMIFFQL